MLQRVDAMEQELTALIESLRTGANRLNADLSLLESNMDDLYKSAGGSRGEPVQAVAEQREVPAPPAPRPVPTQAAAPAPAPAAVAAPAPAAVEEDEAGDEEPPAAAAPPEPAAVAAPAAGGDTADGGDVEGARLIALNMALNGQSRDETDKYLAENFDLADRQALLDEVYESVGG